MLLLDEPTSGMDIAGTAAILAVLRRLHEKDGLTIVMVSHQINEVARVARRLGLVTDGGLRIGATEDMLTALNLSALYRTPVRVASTDGHRIVFAYDPDDDDSPAGTGGGAP
jgi:ABC-type cobalamin/Fe3+-siderophores transport system ATPase subunit